MKIILARHGKPTLWKGDLLAGRDFGDWVRRYNEAGITNTAEPPPRLRELAASVGWVVASDLRRAVESARFLAHTRDVQIEPELREAALPESIAVPIRMPAGACLVIARVAWWLSWCRPPETVGAARQRAIRAADRLCALADEHGSVLAVGHAVFNRFIATELRMRGWRGPKFFSVAYWATATFVRTAGS